MTNPYHFDQKMGDVLWRSRAVIFSIEKGDAPASP